MLSAFRHRPATCLPCARRTHLALLTRGPTAQELLLPPSPAPTPKAEQRDPSPAAMAMERPVRLVLDASLLLDPVGSGGAGTQEAAPVPTLRPGAEALLRRLRHSNLGVV